MEQGEVSRRGTYVKWKINQINDYRFLQEGANCTFIDKITDNLIKDVRTSKHALSLEIRQKPAKNFRNTVHGNTRSATGNIAIAFHLGK